MRCAPGFRPRRRSSWSRRFICLLTYADVIVLQLFRPPNEVGIYYAAAKTMALVAFIYFSVAQTLAHKFAEYHVAGDRKRLADIPRRRGADDVLAVARFGPGAARARPAAASHVRPRIRLRLLSDVHSSPSDCWRAPRSVRRSGCSTCSASGAVARSSMPALSRSISRLCFLLIPRLGIAGAADRQRDHAGVRVGEPVLRRQVPARTALLYFRRAQGSLRRAHDGQSADRARAACSRTRRRRSPARGAPPSPIVMRSTRLPSSGARFRSLNAIADEWRELAARALMPNVFYEPAFALAAAPVFGRDAGAVLVWSGTSAAQAARLFPGAHRDAALRVQAAGAGRMDASRLPRSACRSSSAKRPSRSLPPGSRISPATHGCPD